MNYDIEEGVKLKTSVELFEFVKENTSEDAVIIFNHPRALSLYTDRYSANVFNVSQEESWRFIKYFNATHIVAGPVEKSRALDILNRYNDKAELLFSNEDFDLYELWIGENP